MITVFTTKTCAYCKMVKQYLSLKGKEFTKKFNHEYSEVLTGQFSDAQVSVVLLTLSCE